MSHETIREKSRRAIQLHQESESVHLCVPLRVLLGPRIAVGPLYVSCPCSRRRLRDETVWSTSCRQRHSYQLLQTNNYQLLLLSVISYPKLLSKAIVESCQLSKAIVWAYYSCSRQIIISYPKLSAAADKTKTKRFDPEAAAADKWLSESTRLTKRSEKDGCATKRFDPQAEKLQPQRKNIRVRHSGAFPKDLGLQPLKVQNSDGDLTISTPTWSSEQTTNEFVRQLYNYIARGLK